MLVYSKNLGYKCGKAKIRKACLELYNKGSPRLFGECALRELFKSIRKLLINMQSCCVRMSILIYCVLGSSLFIYKNLYPRTRREMHKCKLIELDDNNFENRLER